MNKLTSKTINKQITNHSNSENTISTAKQVIPSRRQGKFDQILSFLPFGFSSKPVIAMLRLEGIIGRVSNYKSGLSISVLNKLIEKTFKVDKLTAVCLLINSPGGSPVQSELICSRIMKLAEEKEIPVFSFVEDVAASGGYWLACAGSKIFASKSSIIGSIGVVSASFGFHEAISKLGVERRVYTQGKNKSVLDPFSEAKSSDVKIIKNLQKNIHEHFIDHVKTRRAGKLTQDDDILFNGEFWTGQTALDFGLIDGIDDVYSFIHKHYGTNAKIEYIEHKQSWLKQKLGLSNDFASSLSENLIDNAEEKLIKNKFNLL
ncbi:MAG: S49 family peptidase [Rickettsiaceae bacterium]|nr:S49 family peptidase [Rickettsiaceae bacterium]